MQVDDRNARGGRQYGMNSPLISLIHPVLARDESIANLLQRSACHHVVNAFGANMIIQDRRQNSSC
jgi:hypothetical protein